MNTKICNNSITFFDIDECVARTFAKIIVKDAITKNPIRFLDTKEFNDDVISPNEIYDFSQFRCGRTFLETSKPIKRTIFRIKHMIQKIEEKNLNNKIIFLTARSDFRDKENFLQWFKNHGINVENKNIVYIERSGNITLDYREQGIELPVEKVKKLAVMKYIKDGFYCNIKMVDDYIKNLNAFLEIADTLPNKIIERIKERTGSDTIKFFTLHVNENGDILFHGKREIGNETWG